MESPGYVNTLCKPHRGEGFRGYVNQQTHRGTGKHPHMITQNPTGCPLFPDQQGTDGTGTTGADLLGLILYRGNRYPHRINTPYRPTEPPTGAKQETDRGNTHRIIKAPYRSIQNTEQTPTGNQTPRNRETKPKTPHTSPPNDL